MLQLVAEIKCAMPIRACVCSRMVLPLSWQRAAYYDEEVAGNPTASGELYDPSGFTTAHKALPFGTVLEVCYHDCTEVTVNDRNPNSEADLDLSPLPTTSASPQTVTA